MQQALDARPVKRALGLAIAALLAIGTALALTGCGGASDEQVISEGIAKELDAFKNPTQESLQPYIGEIDADQKAALESYGIDIYEFIEHAFRGFDYELGDVTVNGDTATAVVKVSNIDVSKITSEVMDSLSTDEKLAAELEELAEKGDQAEIMKYVFNLVYKSMDAATETVSSDTTLKLTKTNNEWNIDEDSISDMISGMYGGLVG